MFEAEKDDERRANNARALATLRGLGCTLHDISLPDGDLTYFISTYFVVLWAAMRKVHTNYVGTGTNNLFKIVVTISCWT